MGSAPITRFMKLTELRETLGEVLNQVGYGSHRIILMSPNRPLAVLIGAEDFKEICDTSHFLVDKEPTEIHLSMGKFRAEMSEVVNEVCHSGNWVFLKRRGKVLGVIVEVDQFTEIYRESAKIEEDRREGKPFFAHPIAEATYSRKYKKRSRIKGNVKKS